MSKTEKQSAGQKPDKQDAGQKPDKIVTKYDLKMQRRKEEKEKELRDRRVGRVIGVLLAVVLVCIVVSFPVRSWLTLHETYIEVNGQKITRVEYDYNYHVVSDSFISQYYDTYLYYMGVDLRGDLDKQMYSGTLTWKDHFDEMTVEHLAQSKSLLKEAQDAGFTYDVAQDYDEYMDSLKKAAGEANVSLKEYIRRLYGSYATESRVKPYVEEAMYLLAYNEVIEERFTPSQEEIQEYYDNNTASYDSVDYYLYKVEAQLPTEPTELSGSGEDAEAGGEEAPAEDGTVTPYEPTEEEIAAAMEEARKEAEKAENRVKTLGEEKVNVKKVSVVYALQDWLFDEERKAGDTTVVEDATNNCYYAVEFEKRYLDRALTADIRVVMTAEDNGQAILDEWKSGSATEESFGEICEKYGDVGVTTLEGGLYEDVSASAVPAELKEWVFDSSRAKGDTAVISPENIEYTYVIYYVGPGEEEWILTIRNVLLNQRLREYLDGLVESAQIEDPHKNLNYLKVREEEAAAGSEENPGGEESQESGESGSEGEQGSDENESEGEESEEGSSN